MEQKQSTSQIPLPLIQTSWTIPSIEYFKLNNDVIIDNDGMMGLGVTCRDYNGRVILISRRWLPLSDYAKIAELSTLQYGIELVRRRGIQNSIVERDTQRIILRNLF